MKWGEKECQRIRDQEARRSQGDQERVEGRENMGLGNASAQGWGC